MPALAEIHMFAVWLTQLVRLCSQQSITVEFQAAASRKLNGILAYLPGGDVAWWKLVPDSQRYLLSYAGLGAASGFLIFGLVKMNKRDWDVILHIYI